MTDIKLTDIQRDVLAFAAENTGGIIEWFPKNINGGARTKVLRALENHGLAEYTDGTWVLTDAGFDAMAMHRPASPKAAPAKLTRANSKQAEVIAMLKRSEGATIGEICTATGWQQHTVRGTFAGAFKKKLGLEITSVKELGRDRVYRIN